MAHLLSWPKHRKLGELIAELSPGRLVLFDSRAAVVVDCQDPEELRAFALQVYAAAIEYDQERQHAAAKASTDRRQRRLLAGETLGDRSQRFTDPPEPPAHMSLEIPA